MAFLLRTWLTFQTRASVDRVRSPETGGRPLLRAPGVVLVLR